MKFLIKLVTSVVAIIILGEILPGVTVDTYTTAFIVAIVLAILNVLVKPLLILLTLPITIVTFGLFLLIINALMILLADNLIEGFAVSNIWAALIFSILLSILQSVLNSLVKEDKK